MGRLTPAQQKQLDDLQAQKDAPDDEEVSVWVRNKDGHETRLTGQRAENWLTRNGYSADDADDATSVEPLEPKGGAAPAKKTAAPVKKAAAPAAGAEPDAEPEVETDAAPRTTRGRAFF